MKAMYRPAFSSEKCANILTPKYAYIIIFECFIATPVYLLMHHLTESHQQSFPFKIKHFCMA